MDSPSNSASAKVTAVLIALSTRGGNHRLLGIASFPNSSVLSHQRITVQAILQMMQRLVPDWRGTPIFARLFFRSVNLWRRHPKPPASLNRPH